MQNYRNCDMTALLTTDIKSLPFLHRGKVRDIYAVGEDKLLVIQTDRLSAFDVILDDPIPGLCRSCGSEPGGRACRTRNWTGR